MTIIDRKNLLERFAVFDNSVDARAWASTASDEKLLEMVLSLESARRDADRYGAQEADWMDAPNFIITSGAASQ